MNINIHLKSHPLKTTVWRNWFQSTCEFYACDQTTIPIVGSFWLWRDPGICKWCCTSMLIYTGKATCICRHINLLCLSLSRPITLLLFMHFSLSLHALADYWKMHLLFYHLIMYYNYSTIVLQATFHRTLKYPFSQQTKLKQVPNERGYLKQLLLWSLILWATELSSSPVNPSLKPTFSYNPSKSWASNSVLLDYKNCTFKPITNWMCTEPLK